MHFIINQDEWALRRTFCAGRGACLLKNDEDNNNPAHSSPLRWFHPGLRSARLFSAAYLSKSSSLQSPTALDSLAGTDSAWTTSLTGAMGKSTAMISATRQTAMVRGC